jgi:hypothetical protein
MHCAPRSLLSLAFLTVTLHAAGCASGEPAPEAHGASESHLSGRSVCNLHPFPASRRLCNQAFDAGATEEQVRACGFINLPSVIQGCLRDLAGAAPSDPPPPPEGDGKTAVTPADDE